MSRVDPTALDWGVVRSATARVRQHYRYTYTGPVWDLHQRLVMVPRDSYRGQRLLAHDLVVRGTEGDHRVTWERDEFGNRATGQSIGRRAPTARSFQGSRGGRPQT